jgi:hypothetical protein
MGFNMKMKFDKSMNHNNGNWDFGFRVKKDFARLDQYRTYFDVKINFCQKEYRLTFYFGKALNAIGFSEVGDWKQGRVVTCYNTTETVQLRKDKQYTVREIMWKNGGDGYLYPRISLMELDPSINYGVERFYKQNLTDEDFEY